MASFQLYLQTGDTPLICYRSGAPLAALVRPTPWVCVTLSRTFLSLWTDTTTRYVRHFALILLNEASCLQQKQRRRINIGAAVANSFKRVLRSCVQPARTIKVFIMMHHSRLPPSCATVGKARAKRCDLPCGVSCNRHVAGAAFGDKLSPGRVQHQPTARKRIAQHRKQQESTNS